MMTNDGPMMPVWATSAVSPLGLLWVLYIGTFISGVLYIWGTFILEAPYIWGTPIYIFYRGTIYINRLIPYGGFPI